MTTRMQLERAMLATPAARALDANSLAQLRSHIPRLSDAELASLIRANVGNVQTRTTWKTDPIRTDQAKLARYLKQVEATTIAAAKAGSSPARTHEQNKAEAFKVGAYVGKKATREAAARCIDNRFKQGLVTPAQAERVLAATQAQHLGLNGDLFAQQVIISDSEAWQRVQRTVLSEVRPVFDREMGEVYNEMRGIQHRMEARSLTETGAGILLSWFLDPQIMLTAGVPRLAASWYRLHAAHHHESVCGLYGSWTHLRLGRRGRRVRRCLDHLQRPQHRHLLRSGLRTIHYLLRHGPTWMARQRHADAHRGV